ncbi:MAG: hypothetical protein ACRDNZ_06305 [Streptosporangiaceae bacterium]
MMDNQEFREYFIRSITLPQDFRPPAIAVIRRRARRRVARCAAALTAAAAGASAVTGMVLTSLPATTRPSPGPAGPASRSVPPATTPPGTAKPVTAAANPGRYPPGSPYLVLLSTSANTVTVRNMATGMVTGTVTEPDAGYRYTYVAAAPDDDREFILAAQTANLLSTRFYVLRLDAAGHPLPPRLLPDITEVNDRSQVYGMAVSNGGTELAVSTIIDSDTSPDGKPADLARLWVFTLGPSGGVHGWTHGESGTISSLSFDAVGELGFSWTDGPELPSDGLQILGPQSIQPGPSGPLPFAAQAAVSDLDAAASGQLTLDGSTVLAIGMYDGNGDVNLKVFSTSSGRLRETVPLVPMVDSWQGGHYCGILWSSPTGDEVLTQCGDSQEWVNAKGQATPVHLAIMIPAPAGLSGNFAW